MEMLWKMDYSFPLTTDRKNEKLDRKFSPKFSQFSHFSSLTLSISRNVTSLNHHELNIPHCAFSIHTKFCGFYQMKKKFICNMLRGITKERNFYTHFFSFSSFSVSVLEQFCTTKGEREQASEAKIKFSFIPFCFADV